MIGALLCVGAATRIYGLVIGRSLTIDEAMLAFNFVQRPWRDLYDAAIFEQVAPPLFVVLEKAAVSLLGVADRSLRIVPGLVSTGLFVLVAALARRLVGNAGAVIAVLLAVASPLFFEYYDEVKQYGTEAVVTALLILLALRVLDEPDHRGRGFALGLTGLVAPTLSLPSAFVLGGIGIALLLTPAAPERPGRRRRVWLMLTTWALGVLLLYAVYYAPRASDPYLARYWAGAYPEPGLFAAVRGLAAYGVQFVGRVFLPTRTPSMVIALALTLLVVAGSVRLVVRQGVPVAVMFSVPPLAAAAAAILGKYPLSARLWMFALPLVLVPATAGLEWLVSWVRSGWRDVARVALAAALTSTAFVHLIRILGSDRHFDVAPMADAVAVWRASARPGDAVYVGNQAIPAWIFYTTVWSNPGSRLSRLLRDAQSLGPNAGNIPSRRAPVAGEGDLLVWNGSHGRELLGIPTGMEVLMGVPERATPDPGWAENEARRILTDPQGCIWLLFVGWRRAPRDELLAVLQARGAEYTAAWEQARTTVIGLRSPGEVRSCRPQS